MTREQLFESLQYLDDEVLERSERFRAARPAWVRWAAAAACVCLAAGAVWLAETRTHRLLPAAEQRAAVTMPMPAPNGGEFSYGVEWEPLPERGAPPPEREDGERGQNILTPGIDEYIFPEPTAVPTPEPVPEPTPMPSGAPGPWTGGIYLPAEGGGEQIISGGTPRLISSYDAGEAAEAACYAVPENGEAGYSIPLRGAMEEYGGGVWYRVAVELFADGAQLDPDGPEAAAERERLAGLGYIVETYFDGESERHYFTLHAHYDNLTSFAAGADYGYMLFLYDERVK